MRYDAAVVDTLDYVQRHIRSRQVAEIFRRLHLVLATDDSDSRYFDEVSRSDDRCIIEILRSYDHGIAILFIHGSFHTVQPILPLLSYPIQRLTCIDERSQQRERVGRESVIHGKQCQQRQPRPEARRYHIHIPSGGREA